MARDFASHLCEKSGMAATSKSSPASGNLQRLLGAARSGLDGDANLIREAWDTLARVPGGKLVFSQLVGRMAAYTGTIGARVEELRHGYAEVSMRDRAKLRNHLRSVHAIALANLAELTGNIAVAYSMPDDARFIVAGLTIDYTKKARGTIRGICNCPNVTSNERKEYPVIVLLNDESGDEVAKVTLRTLVGPKKSSR
jgi:uncharacterized protein (TIGR00369 family)